MVAAHLQNFSTDQLKFGYQHQQICLEAQYNLFFSGDIGSMRSFRIAWNGVPAFCRVTWPEWAKSIVRPMTIASLVTVHTLPPTVVGGGTRCESTAEILTCTVKHNRVILCYDIDISGPNIGVHWLHAGTFTQCDAVWGAFSNA